MQTPSLLYFKGAFLGKISFNLCTGVVFFFIIVGLFGLLCFSIILLGSLETSFLSTCFVPFSLLSISLLDFLLQPLIFNKNTHKSIIKNPFTKIGRAHV